MWPRQIVAARPFGRHALLRWPLVVVPASIQKIAPLPPIAIEVLNRIPALTNAPDSALHAVLGRDEELLAQAVFVADRSGLPANPVEEIPAADLAEIALSLSLRRYMRSAFEVDEDRRYWCYTLACAFACKELAELDGKSGSRAYAAGLLHDLGRLALIASYPAKYANLLALTNGMFESARPFDLSEYERVLFGMDRFATGEWLAAAWRLPGWLRPVMGKFIAQPTGGDAELTENVRTGTQLAHALGLGYLAAAPRLSIRQVLSKRPAALRHWDVMNQWKLGEEVWRTAIESRLSWY